MGTDGFLIETLACPWDSMSAPLERPGYPGPVREVLNRGAFEDQIKAQRECEAWLNHNEGLVLARRSDGTLFLFEAHDGLRIRVDPSLSGCAAWLRAEIESGRLCGASVGMRLQPRDYIVQHETVFGLVRRIYRAELREVSLTGSPGFRATTTRIVKAPPPRLMELQRWVVKGDFEHDTSNAHFQRATELDMALLEFEGYRRGPALPWGRQPAIG